MARQRYSSARERFSADFPGTVERRFTGYFPDDGLSPATVTFICRPSRVLLYQVGVTRLAGYSGSPEDFLDVALAEFVASIRGAKLADRSRDTFKGTPAIRFMLVVGRNVEVDGLAVLERLTLYMLTLMRPHGTQHDFDRYCEGFEIGPQSE